VASCEENHLTPSSTDVKNEWSYTSTCHGMYRDKFTFLSLAERMGVVD
jgi:hypothetical protein